MKHQLSLRALTKKQQSNTKNYIKLIYLVIFLSFITKNSFPKFHWNWLSVSWFIKSRNQELKVTQMMTSSVDLVIFQVSFQRVCCKEQLYKFSFKSMKKVSRCIYMLMRCYVITARCKISDLVCLKEQYYNFEFLKNISIVVNRGGCGYIGKSSVLSGV